MLTLKYFVCSFSIVLIIGMNCGCSGKSQSVLPSKDARIINCNQFSTFSWCGRVPNTENEMLIIASAEQNPDISITRILLSLFCKASGSKIVLKKDTWKSEVLVSTIAGLKVYPIAQKGMLLCVMDVAGADSGGVLVVKVNREGKTRTLFEEMNYGNPEFQMIGDDPTIREIWPIYRLTGREWMPTREYDSHVLVERVFHMSEDDKFVLETTRPAVEEEQRLSKEDYQNLAKERQARETELKKQRKQ